MQVEVLMVPSNQIFNLADKKVVVIDVLRATSTIVTAFGNGALEIVPVMEPAEVVDLVKRIGPKEFLTGGERKGFKIEGFDLGNSPSEYAEERVKGRKIILCTTNGTKAIKTAQSAAELYIGSFLNMQAVVNHLKGSSQDLVLVCSGRDQNLCLEDLACAGLMIELLKDEIGNDLTDSAKLAQYVWEKAGVNLEEFIKQTQHGRYLKEIGLEQDIHDCMALNQYEIVPRYV
ncbi:MAG TPA: 2-phosphosulfolactate phosphatase, partial [Firmicutes bacterium]|nr:2-phosphosulfolactate phosphatase [Bacillota bacterium]